MDAQRSSLCVVAAGLSRGRNLLLHPSAFFLQPRLFRNLFALLFQSLLLSCLLALVVLESRDARQTAPLCHE